jgi:uncharacterized protein
MLVVPCPICQKRMEVRQLADWPSFPFCSPKCRLIDLGRWLGEEYRTPADGEDSDEESSPSVGPSQPAEE